MNLEFMLASVAFVCSFGLNVYLLHRLKKVKGQPQPTYDAVQLMRDLTMGKALVRIERVAPEQVFLRSPRDLA